MIQMVRWQPDEAMERIKDFARRQPRQPRTTMIVKVFGRRSRSQQSSTACHVDSRKMAVVMVWRDARPLSSIGFSHSRRHDGDRDACGSVADRC
jgi:hypothetical protein